MGNPALKKTGERTKGDLGKEGGHKAERKNDLDYIKALGECEGQYSRVKSSKSKRVGTRA